MNANPTFDGDSEEYIPAGEDQIDERLAALDDDEANLRAETLRAGLSDYELDDEDAALLSGSYDEYDEDAPLRLDPEFRQQQVPGIPQGFLVAQPCCRLNQRRKRNMLLSHESKCSTQLRRRTCCTYYPRVN